MKAIGNFTNTDGRQTTEMINGTWVSLGMSQKSFDILNIDLSEEELGQEDRWYDIESDGSGRMFATTGTVDLDYYTEIE